jgi:hypothetical protein
MNIIVRKEIFNIIRPIHIIETKRHNPILYRIGVIKTSENKKNERFIRIKLFKNKF